MFPFHKEKDVGCFMKMLTTALKFGPVMQVMFIITHYCCNISEGQKTEEDMYVFFKAPELCAFF